MLIKVFLAIFLSVFSLCSRAQTRALFLDNDIIEIKDDSTFWQNKSRSVAMMVSSVFYEVEDDIYQLEEFMFEPYSSTGDNVCKDEPFLWQKANPVSCTGFLVAPNILATAGHCVLSHGTATDDITPECVRHSWIFDFKLGESNSLPMTGKSSEKIYHCKRIIYAENDSERRYSSNGSRHGLDFALIELDRIVPDREPLKLVNKTPSFTEELHLIGYPLGLPMKSAHNGFVTIDQNPFFYEASLDSFGGNSGSPVLDEKGDVVGVLVRGPMDFYYDEESRCERLNRCDSNGKNCVNDAFAHLDDNNGMHIQKTSFILDFLK